MPPPEQRNPFPDRAHEDLATWVEETLAGLRQARADVDDGLLLTDTLFTLVGGALTSIDTGQVAVADQLLLVDTLFTLVDALLVWKAAAIAGVDALQDAMASLSSRVQALEALVV